MKRSLLSIAVLGLAGVFATALRLEAQSAATGVLQNAASESLAGEWKLVSVELNGEALPADKLQSGRLSVDGPNYRLSLLDAKLPMTYRVDASARPKTLDLTIAEGADQGQTFKAIYKLEGDTLTVCRNLKPNEARPTEFASRSGSGVLLVVWTRFKP